MSRISRDKMFMEIAYIVAKRGTCPRAKVGAVLVDRNNKIRSIGYNGNAPGHPHCEDVGCRMVDGHCSSALHAEVNALNHYVFLTGALERYDNEYTLYVTHKPCHRCAPEIIKSGRVSRVVYGIPYRYEGPDSFTEGGVVFERYKESNV